MRRGRAADKRKRRVCLRYLCGTRFHTLELRKHGIKLKLAGQPQEVLALMLERPGDLILRDELQKQLWPDDTVVGFEDGINTAINRLRHALGDDPDRPRYVETLPRRGYRFIHPVSMAESRLATDALAPAGAALHARSEKLPKGGPFEERAVGASNPRRLVGWLWVVGGVALLALAVGIYLLRGRPAIDSLAVLPFASVGSGPNTEYLSEGLSEQLINSLSQFPQLRVIARTTAFTYKGLPIDIAKVGKDLRVRAVLTGKIVERGDSLTVQVDLVSTGDGSELWGQQFHGHASDLQAVDEEIARQVSAKLRVKLSGKKKNGWRNATRKTPRPTISTFRAAICWTKWRRRRSRRVGLISSKPLPKIPITRWRTQGWLTHTPTPGSTSLNLLIVPFRRPGRRLKRQSSLTTRRAKGTFPWVSSSWSLIGTGRVPSRSCAGVANSVRTALTCATGTRTIWNAPGGCRRPTHACLS